MSDVFQLTKKQLNRIKPYFPVSHGVPRVDDLRVISAIIYVIRYGLQWKDAPKAYGPHKTVYNPFVRWSRAGNFDTISRELSRIEGTADCLMIDATHLKAHRTAASLLKNGRYPVYWPHKRWPELEGACRLRRHGPAGASLAVGSTDERLHGSPAPSFRPSQRSPTDRQPWV